MQDQDISWAPGKVQGCLPKILRQLNIFIKTHLDLNIPLLTYFFCSVHPCRDMSPPSLTQTMLSSPSAFYQNMFLYKEMAGGGHHLHLRSKSLSYLTITVTSRACSGVNNLSSASAESEVECDRRTYTFPSHVPASNKKLLSMKHVSPPL